MGTCITLMRLQSRESRTEHPQNSCTPDTPARSVHYDVLPAALLPLRGSATLQSIEADAYPGEGAQGALRNGPSPNSGPPTTRGRRHRRSERGLPLPSRTVICARELQ